MSYAAINPSGGASNLQEGTSRYSRLQNKTLLQQGSSPAQGRVGILTPPA